MARKKSRKVTTGAKRTARAKLRARDRKLIDRLATDPKRERAQERMRSEMEGRVPVEAAEQIDAFGVNARRKIRRHDAQVAVARFDADTRQWHRLRKRDGQPFKRPMSRRQLANLRRSTALKAYWGEVRSLREGFEITTSEARALARIAQDPGTAAALDKLRVFPPSPNDTK